MDYDIILVALAAFIGGVLSAILGWLDSQEPFNPRKFAKSLGFALVAGLGFAVAYNFSDGVTIRDLITAFLGGAGWDAVTNRFIGSVTRRDS